MPGEGYYERRWHLQHGDLALFSRGKAVVQVRGLLRANRDSGAVSLHLAMHSPSFPTQPRTSCKISLLMLGVPEASSSSRCPALEGQPAPGVTEHAEQLHQEYLPQS